MSPVVSQIVVGLSAGILVLLSTACAGDPPPSPRLAVTDRAIGLELDLLAMPPAERRASVARAARMGFRWLRLPLNWAVIEARRGHPAWSALDDSLASAESVKLQVLVGVHGAPAWARHDPPPPDQWWLCDAPEARAPGTAELAPPSDPQDLARFLTHLAARHAPRVAAVEVWREPNVLPNWRAGGPDPEDYGRLLVAATQAVRRAAPSWRVVSAGLAPVRVAASPVCFQSDLVFLDRLAASGALDAVDAVGVQPLGLEAPALDPPVEDSLNFRRAELYRDGLVRRGLADKPVWLLATGWRVSADGRSSPWGAWTPESAVAELDAAWRLARGSWPWAGPLFLRHDDPGIRASDNASGYRLWLGDGPDAALTAVGTWASRIAAEPLAPAGESETAAVRGYRPALAPWWPAVPGAAAALVGLILFLSAWRDVASAASAGTPSMLDRIPMVQAMGSRLAQAARKLAGWRAVGLALVLVLANAYLPSGPGLACLLGLGLVGLLHPIAILTVAPAILPWHDTLRLRLWSRPILPFEGLLLLTLVACLTRELVLGSQARSLLGARAADRRRGDLGLVLLLTGWGAVAAALARISGAAWFEWRTVIMEPALYFLLLRHCADRWTAMRQPLLGLVGGSAAAAALGLAGLLLTALSGAGLAIDTQWASAVAAEGVLRARGPYGSPNNLALWLGRSLPLAVAAGMAAFPSGSALRRWLPATLIGVGLLATFSRGSWVLGLPALGLVAVLAWRRRDRSLSSAGRGRRLSGKLPAAITAVAVALALLLSPLLASERLRGTLSLAPGSTAYIRWRLWQSSVAMIDDHPWTGVGPDNFLYAYRDRYVQRDVVQERSLSHPHNLFLDWAARMGLPGLAIGMLLMGTAGLALRRATTARRWSREDEREAWLWGLIGMQAYILAHGLVDNHFFLVDLAAAQWLLLAAARSLAQVDAASLPDGIKDMPT